MNIERENWLVYTVYTELVGVYCKLWLKWLMAVVAAVAFVCSFEIIALIRDSISGTLFMIESNRATPSLCLPLYQSYQNPLN